MEFENHNETWHENKDDMWNDKKYLKECFSLLAETVCHEMNNAEKGCGYSLTCENSETNDPSKPNSKTSCPNGTSDTGNITISDIGDDEYIWDCDAQ